MPASFSLRREFAWVIATLVLSIALLPAAIVTLGGRLFGPYRGGLVQFYANLGRDLSTLTWSAWVLVLGPALALIIVRALLRPRASRRG